MSAPSTSGSLRYVAPAKRARRNEARVDLELAEIDNKMAAEARAAAKYQGVRLPTFALPYYVHKPAMATLTSRFPRTVFTCSADLAHDHPIAHAETMIGSARIARMVPAGHTVVDLFGSPSKLDALNRAQARSNQPKRFMAYVGLKTEKDYIRALKWGPEFNVDGSRRYMRGQNLLDDIAPTMFGIHPAFGLPIHAESGYQRTDLLTYTSIHTLYYLRDDEIASLLSVQGSRMLALVHRHPYENGKLFNGECSYAKISGTVEQVNTLTGERYVHQDLSWLWDSTTKVKRFGRLGFVWTMHMVSEDTWIIEMTGCPSDLDERFDSRANELGDYGASVEMNMAAEEPSHFPHPALAKLPGATCKLVGGIPVLSFDPKLGLLEVRLSCQPLYDFLCTSMVGKPRDPDRINDLFSSARMHVASGSDFPGKQNFVLPHQDIAGHVVLAYITGLEDEVALLRALGSFSVWSREHKALLDGSSVVLDSTVGHEEHARTALVMLKRVNNARKENGLLGGIIGALN